VDVGVCGEAPRAGLSTCTVLCRHSCGHLSVLNALLGWSYGSRRHGLMCGARRRTTVSRGGLHQGSSRRYGLLHRTWWRTAVSRGGLYQVS